jgi:hypothetical protein
MFSPCFSQNVDYRMHCSRSIRREVYVYSRRFCGLGEAFEVLVEVVYRLTLNSSGVPEQSVSVGQVRVCFLACLAVPLGSEVELLSSPFVRNAFTDLPDQPFMSLKARMIQC